MSAWGSPRDIIKQLGEHPGVRPALTHSQVEQQTPPALIKFQVFSQASAVLIAGNPQGLLQVLLCLLAGIEQSKEAAL